MTPEQKIIVDIEKLLGLILTEYTALKNSLPPNDIRPTFYSLPGNVLVSFHLQMNAFDSTICEKSWWIAKFNKNEPTALDMEALKSLEKFTKHSFLVFYFSRLETNIKKIINIISPGFDPKNKKSFFDVYNEFLKKLGLFQFVELFDIVRQTRNTIHSNGIYISNSATDIQYSWKGKTYNFKHLKQIDFVSFDELLYLFYELFYFVKEIMDTTIMRSTHFIEDKFH